MNHSQGASINPAVNTTDEVIVSAKGLRVYYGDKEALKGIDFSITKLGVTALIGPSGCGKSTFLRTLNRMNDRIPGFRVTGNLIIEGENPYAKGVDLLELRRKVGMVFQKPNPFPKSIYENIAVGPRAHYGIRGSKLDQVVEEALNAAALWDEVKDDYKRKSGLSLSGGQQQRLCIARMLAVNPDIVLMDEPCSALDPISTGRIEELIVSLSQTKTVVIVTHNLQQAERVSSHTAFFMFGELVEAAPTEELFANPQRDATRDYVSGRFG
ncbi:MAG: phosphate ABC transporter ATP-binding protein PstB [Fimbriimonadaceae bacterium]|jgi:phosphate transport system ATP-binding protein|nr:phosphate ABC transporter ATP-binding protein PstB [Fimbriimonadaceae bacterium]